MLRELHDAWTEAPAYHYVAKENGPGIERVREGWFLRDKGRREEVRHNNELVGVVVNNGRWEFRWDVPDQMIAAWSAALVGGPARTGNVGLLVESEAFLKWAEDSRAKIDDHSETLDGRTVRKVALSWPGPAGAGPLPQSVTVWFDPGTHRPLRLETASADGFHNEARIDYPDPKTMSAERFAFRPPKDITLEINDPDLGRQVYSEGHAKPAVAGAQEEKGANR